MLLCSIQFLGQMSSFTILFSILCDTFPFQIGLIGVLMERFTSVLLLNLIYIVLTLVSSGVRLVCIAACSWNTGRQLLKKLCIFGSILLGNVSHFRGNYFWSSNFVIAMFMYYFSERGFLSKKVSHILLFIPLQCFEPILFRWWFIYYLFFSLEKSQIYKAKRIR